MSLTHYVQTCYVCRVSQPVYFLAKYDHDAANLESVVLETFFLSLFYTQSSDSEDHLFAFVYWPETVDQCLIGLDTYVTVNKGNVDTEHRSQLVLNLKITQLHRLSERRLGD